MDSSPSGYFLLIDAPLAEIKGPIRDFQNAVDALVTGLTGGGGGPVTSFNGRVGVVVSATNDYTWAQINKATSSLADIATRSASDLSSGTLDAARLPTGIDAAKIGDGSVSTTEFQYINSVTSNVQTQLDAKASTAYVDSAVVGLLDDRGNYDASGNVFPSSGGSGTAGAILKGDLWTISVAGTLGGHVVTAGDVVRALADTPGQTDSNWAIGENNFGYVALNQALADGKIYVGNASGIGTAVTPSGDVTISNAGVTAINPAITPTWTGTHTFSNATYSALFTGGNVGIGVTSPAYLLHLRRTTSGVSVNIGLDGWSDAERGLYFRTNTGGASTTRWTVGIPADGSGEPGGNVGSDFTINRYNDAGTLIDPVLFVKRSSGNVGIGETSPGYKLDVGGTFRSAGVATFQVDANPLTNYTSNLGALSNKYLTLHAAELWVETLVAQNTMATIGGRVLVAPTTPLAADAGTGATTITTKYNNLQNGDRVYLEADGKVEFMAITSSASGSAGAYVYSVTRNLDGSGANQWFAGDAVLNTGTTGNGYIDLYSVSGVIPGSTAGPTIVGNVRTGTTYNNIEPRWAIGNLNGLYGYSGSTYGAAFGVPTGAWVKIDPTNGVRIGHNATTLTQIDASGNASFSGTVTAGAGAIGGFSIGADYIRDAANSFGLASTVTGGDDVRFWAGDTFANRAIAPFNVTEAGVVTMTSGAIAGKLIMSGASSAIAIGSTPPTSATAGTGLWLDRTGFYSLSSNLQRVLITATDITLKHGGRLFFNDGTANVGAIVGGNDTVSTSQVSLGSEGSGSYPDALTQLSSNAASQSLFVNLLSGSSASEVRLFSGLGTLSGFTIGADAAPNAMLDVRGDAIVTGLLKAGSVPTTLTSAAGLILDAALSSNVPLKNAVNTFTAGQVIRDGTNRNLYLHSDAGAFGTAGMVIQALNDALDTYVPLVLAGSKVLLFTLPTSDPAVAGQLWNDSGTVKISAG